MGGGTAEIRALQDAFGRLTDQIERLQKAVAAIEMGLGALDQWEPKKGFSPDAGEQARLLRIAEALERRLAVLECAPKARGPVAPAAPAVPAGRKRGGA